MEKIFLAIGTLIWGALVFMAGNDFGETSSNLESWISYLNTQFNTEQTNSIFLYGSILILSVLLAFLIFRKPKDVNILFLEPKWIYDLEWDAPENLQIITRPRLQLNENPPDFRLPIFRLKNLGSDVLKNINIQWNLPKNILSSKILKSNSFSKYNISYLDNFINFSHQTQSVHNKSGYKVSLKDNNFYTYLSPQIDNETYMDIEIPNAVFGALETFFIASIPDNATLEDSVSTIINVKISYEEKNKNISKNYKVLVFARSQRPWSNVDFKIAEGDILRTPPARMLEVKFKIER